MVHAGKKGAPSSWTHLSCHKHESVVEYYTSNNANGNKRVIFFSGIAGDNDFIIRTFDFIARSDAHT